MEQDKYINEIVKLTTQASSAPAAAAALNLINASPQGYAANSCMISLMNDSHSINQTNPVAAAKGALKTSPAAAFNSSSSSYSAATPLTNRRSVFASKIERAVQTFKQNYNNHSTAAAPASAASSTNQAFLISHPCSYGNHRGMLALIFFFG